MPAKRKATALTFVLALLTSAIAGTNLANLASAIDLPSVLDIAMPIEYINYTITSENGTLWAKIDGIYPLHVISEPADTLNLDNSSLFVTSNELPLVYPTPPGTTNIQIRVDETELEWSNFTKIYPSALHHTVIGDWSIINCSITPIPDDFVLKIHYEHPLQKINGTYLFLYDLNISPYLSPLHPNSTAYFIVRAEAGVSILQAFTAGFNGAWKPKAYVATQEYSAEVAYMEMFSEFNKPLAGDLVVSLRDGSAPEPFHLTLVIASIMSVAVVGLGLLVHFKKRKS